MTSVAVVILNYNGEKLIPQFLPSVVQHSASAEVIVIDNASTDQSISILQTQFPSVRLLKLDKNYGFCGGYNKGLSQINAKYYVLLNSDIEVTPSWLEPMVQLMERSTSIVAVQPKILSYTAKNKFEYAGAGGGYIDPLGYPFCRGRLFNVVETDTGQYNDTREVFWASGACMMIRSTTFQQFQGLDEDFFAHMEEIDLCWKINRTAGEVYYCGESTVYHLGAGTLGYESPRKTYLNFRNGLTLLYKHLDSVEFFYKLPMRIALDWLASFVFLLQGKSANAGSVWKAHFHFIGDIGKNRIKRKQIRDAHPHYKRKNIYKNLIVFDFYLRGKRKLTINNPR